MNAIYKVIWNDALQLFQAVNEMTRSHRRSCSEKSADLSAADTPHADVPAGNSWKLSLLAGSVLAAVCSVQNFTVGAALQETILSFSAGVASVLVSPAYAEDAVIDAGGTSVTVNGIQGQYDGDG